jgi:hypothetical protein
MYKMGGEDDVSDASAEGSRRRPGRKGKMQGAIRVAVFSYGQASRVVDAARMEMI